MKHHRAQAFFVQNLGPALRHISRTFRSCCTFVQKEPSAVFQKFAQEWISDFCQFGAPTEPEAETSHSKIMVRAGNFVEAAHSC